ncbi:MAG: TIGR00282 family metallophosphoesterase [Alphaproteobacteria bacterium]
MRLLFLGDVVGRAGREIVAAELPRLRADYAIDFVAINGENAAGGFGITERICHALLDAGADVVTTGNHAFDQREAMVFITRQERLLRPVNFPKGAPGQGAGLFEARNGARVLVINAMGRVFMDAMDDPFAAVEAALAETRLGEAVDAIVLDMHAEATSEKQAMAHYLDGRVSLVIGTHTHVPTADHHILGQGTAYMSDLGMCGDYDGILGFEKSGPLNRFLTKLPGERFTPALGEATLSGLAVEIDDATGLATKLAPLRIGGRLSPAMPDFWE